MKSLFPGRRDGGHRPPSLARPPSRRRRSLRLYEEVRTDALAAPNSDRAGIFRIRLFVCAGRVCKDACGGKELMAALKREIAASGGGAAHLDVQPCACLDRCGEGPVVLAYDGRAACSIRPPRGMLNKLLRRPIATFLRAQASEARTMIDTLKTKSIKGEHHV